MCREEEGEESLYMRKVQGYNNYTSVPPIASPPFHV